MDRWTGYLMRIILYCVGLMVLAFGVVFSINSNLGVSPVSSFPYILSLITGVDLGMMVTATLIFYLFLQFAIEGRSFKWINLTQILFSFLFGYFVDFAKAVLGSFALPTYFGQLTLLGISIVLVAIGVSVYMDAGIMNMPMEGLMTTVSKKTKNKSFGQVKVVIDTLVVMTGIVLSLIFLGSLQGIREGTVLCAILVGKLIPHVKRVTRPVFNRIGQVDEAIETIR